MGLTGNQVPGAHSHSEREVEVWGFREEEFTWGWRSQRLRGHAETLGTERTLVPNTSKSPFHTELFIDVSSDGALPRPGLCLESVQ